MIRLDQPLVALGFTRRQTQFLELVARHGGFCLRRQYLAFAGIRHGKGTRRFFDRLVERGLADRQPCRRDRGHVYQLTARSFYHRVGQDDLRHRRVASAALIARRVMVFDYVLSHLNRQWLVTDDEKRAYFGTTAIVGSETVPVRPVGLLDPVAGSERRAFAHKLPMAVVDNTVDLVVLVLDPTARSLDLFLTDHARLLARLPAWRVVAIAPANTVGLQACPHVFGQHVHQVDSGNAPARPALTWYFATRRRIENGDLTEVSVADIDRYKSIRDRLTTVADETRYVRWLHDGDAALKNASDDHTPGRTTRGSLATYELPFTYGQFGSLPGIA